MPKRRTDRARPTEPELTALTAHTGTAEPVTPHQKHLPRQLPWTHAAAPARATFLTRGSGERTPRAGSELGNKQGSQGALHMGKQEPRRISQAQNMCFPVPPTTVSGSLSGFRHFPQGAETGRCDSSLHSALPRPRAHAAGPRVPGTTVLAELEGANSHAMRGGAGAE